jgi:hypothetical protein
MRRVTKTKMATTSTQPDNEGNGNGADGPLRLVTSAGHSRVITGILVGKPTSKATRGSDSPVATSLHGSEYHLWRGGYLPKVLVQNPKVFQYFSSILFVILFIYLSQFVYTRHNVTLPNTVTANWHERSSLTLIFNIEQAHQVVSHCLYF